MAVEKEDIVQYVQETPGNSNPAVLRSLLNQLDDGGSSKEYSTQTVELRVGNSTATAGSPIMFQWYSVVDGNIQPIQHEMQLPPSSSTSVIENVAVYNEGGSFVVLAFAEEEDVSMSVTILDGGNAIVLADKQGMATKVAVIGDSTTTGIWFVGYQAQPK